MNNHKKLTFYIILLLLCELCSCNQLKELPKLNFELSSIKGECMVRYIEFSKEVDENVLLVIGIGDVTINFKTIFNNQKLDYYDRIYLTNSSGDKYQIEGIGIHDEYIENKQMLVINTHMAFKVPKNSDINDFTLNIENPGKTQSYILSDYIKNKR